MATTLYGWTWVGDDEPTTGVLATQEWIQPTTGNRWLRNTSNSAWTANGNVNSNLGGAVAVSGDTMTGPLLDAPNLPPIQDPDFLGTIRQGGFSVALMTALAALEKRTYDRIDYLIQQRVMGASKLSSFAASVAFDSQTVTLTGALAISSGFTIQLPTFRSDSAIATSGQVLGYGAALAGFAYHDDAVTLNTGTWHLQETGSATRVFRLIHTATGSDWGDLSSSNWSFVTWILAVR